jgi:hypothetical protein
MKCVDAELAQMATYVLNYIMIINSVQADFPKIHNLCEAGCLIIVAGLCEAGCLIIVAGRFIPAATSLG